MPISTVKHPLHIKFSVLLIRKRCQYPRKKLGIKEIKRNIMQKNRTYLVINSSLFFYRLSYFIVPMTSGNDLTGLIRWERKG